MVNQNYTQQEKLDLQLASEMLERAIQATDMGKDWPIFREPLDTVNPRVLRDVLEKNNIHCIIIASVFPGLFDFLGFFTSHRCQWHIQHAGNMGDDEYLGNIPGLLLVDQTEWEQNYSSAIQNFPWATSTEHLQFN